MQDAKLLPSDLIAHYHGWQGQDYDKKQAHYHDLIDNGQHPRGMIISCCDSRVMPLLYLKQKQVISLSIVILRILCRLTILRVSIMAHLFGIWLQLGVYILVIGHSHWWCTGLS